MQIVCISRGSQSRGIELAQSLAAKLGYSCLSREDLLQQAVAAGISVEKLSRAMVRSQTLPEPLLLEKDHYRALLTSILCEKALANDLVYHGRIGHLLLSGISHVLRIRVVADLEYRMSAVMRDLNLDRERAKEHIENVEAERRHWVRHCYNVEWDEVSLYDVIVNIERINIDNAAQSLCHMAQLPDFQQTPASRRALEDLYLASRARLALARDERTYYAHLKVHATRGKASVVYQPLQAKVVRFIPEVLAGVEGVEEVVCTSAGTGILWIQERYRPDSDAFHSVAALANKWDAAVELLQFSQSDGGDDPATRNGPSTESQPTAPGGAANGAASEPAEGIGSTVRELISLGRSGGSRSVRGNQKSLLSAIDPTVDYSLIVLGDLFLKKGHSTRTRMLNELRGFLADKHRAPVVLVDELKSQYMFGGKQLGKFLLFLFLAFVLYFIVFTNQERVLHFLSPETFTQRCLTALGVFVFVPIVAYLYGTAARLLLRLIRIE